MPTVSVIVPNYCHAPYLEQRIESILQQTFQDFELILLDDCSTDGSREILERYRNHPKVSGIFYNERNSGRTVPENRERKSRRFRRSTRNRPWLSTTPFSTV